MIRTFAAINVGSFEMEMGIYEMSAKTGIREIDHFKHMIALGRDTYNDGNISHGMVEEMCRVLGDFVREMKLYQVEAYRAYSASAMREAQNSRIVLDQIRVRTGVEIQIISNSETRFISYKAIAGKDAEFQRTIQKGTAIADVGYGSLQLSLFDKDALVSTQNLPLGVLRLREMLSHVSISAKGKQRLVEELVDNELITFRKMYLKDREIVNLIGIGEAILTIFYKMDGERRQGRVSREEFNAFFDKLQLLPLDRLEELFGVNADYAAMLVPTAIIYKRIMEVTGAEVLWVPGIHMTDGIAAEYAENKRLLKFNHSFANDIIVTSRNMAKRYKCHMTHVQTVEKLALEIFDSTKKYHGLKERERLLLQIAAILHSCGKFVTMRNATDCAYNIIMATEMIGLSHMEREIVANVVRYHIQEFKYDQVVIRAETSMDSRLAATDNLALVVAKLTAILRLANSMDRGHKGKLLGSRLSVKGNQLVIATDYDGDVTLENMSIRQKEDFFEEIYGIRPVLKQKKKV